jgi:hypothetical protein
MAVCLLSWGEAQAGGGAQAAIPDANGVFYGCYKKPGEVIKIIDNVVTTCKSGEKLISWNAQGQQGLQGVQGPVGATGPQGPAAPAGATFELGDTGPGSGIVYYVDGSGQHGLEAQLQDENGFLSFQDARSASEAHGPGWHLPTKTELELLHEQKDKVGGLFTGLTGSPEEDTYWSSTRAFHSDVWFQEFQNGTQSITDTPFETHRARAVRAF